VEIYDCCSIWGLRGRDRNVVGFHTTCAISAYRHLWVWFPLRRSVLDTILCDKVCQWLATVLWFTPKNSGFLHK